MGFDSMSAFGTWIYAKMLSFSQNQELLNKRIVLE